MITNYNPNLWMQDPSALFKHNFKTFSSVKDLGLALTAQHHCNCPSSASEINRHTGAIQICLLLLSLLFFMSSTSRKDSMG